MSLFAIFPASLFWVHRNWNTALGCHAHRIEAYFNNVYIARARVSVNSKCAAAAVT